MSPQQAVLCGWLAGKVGGEIREFLGITDLRLAVDPQGNYLPAFEVSLSTGTVLRVTVAMVKAPTVTVKEQS